MAKANLGAALLLSAMLLTGCVSQELSRCGTSELQAIGFADGQAGRVAMPQRHVCLTQADTQSVQAYRQGWTQGIAAYCAPRNGFLVGESGGSYSGSCPQELASPFLVAMEAGRRVFNAANRVDRLTCELDELRQMGGLNVVQQRRYLWRELDDALWGLAQERQQALKRGYR